MTVGRSSFRAVLLRTAISWFAIATLLVLGLHAFRLNVIGKRADERAGVDAAKQALDEHFVALLNQEVGLRGYLATGDERFLAPYDEGRRTRTSTLGAFRLSVPSRFRSGLEAALGNLLATEVEWQDVVASPQLAARRANAAPDLTAEFTAGKRAFDAIRVAQAALAGLLTSDVQATLDAEAREIGLAYVLTFSGLGFLGVFAYALVRNAVRSMAAPLDALAGAASRGGPFPEPGPRDLLEVAVLSTALRQLDGQAREREQRLERQRVDAEEVAAFAEVTQQSDREEDLFGFLHRVLRRVADPSAVRILTRTASENRLLVGASEPALPEDAVDRFAILEEPLRCRAVRTGAEVAFDDARAPTACDCPLGVPAEGSYLCVPLVATGQVVGLVNLQAQATAHFTEERTQRVRQRVSVASTAVGGLRLLGLARERATRDALTGVHNRRFLSEYLPKQTAFAARNKSPLSVMMVDIDYFKRFNDDHGHEAGDRVLTAFAGCLQRQVRASDAVVRYGGEEFAVILPGTDHAGALMLGERIRAAVEGLSLAAAGLPTAVVRASIGVATSPQHGTEDAALLRAADHALLGAKAEGRNRVVSAADGAHKPVS